MIELENYSEEQIFSKNPVLITFDDGDSSLFKFAYPILRNMMYMP